MNCSNFESRIRSFSFGMLVSYVLEKFYQNAFKNGKNDDSVPGLVLGCST